MCVLGKRLLKDITIDQCDKSTTGALWKTFCNSTYSSSCDPYFAGKWPILYHMSIIFDTCSFFSISQIGKFDIICHIDPHFISDYSQQCECCERHQRLSERCILGKFGPLIPRGMYFFFLVDSTLRCVYEMLTLLRNTYAFIRLTFSFFSFCFPISYVFFSLCLSFNYKYQNQIEIPIYWVRQWSTWLRAYIRK